MKVKCTKDGCQNDTDVPETFSEFWKKFALCGPCCKKNSEEALKKEEADRKKIREDEWARICPPAFRDTDISKLPNQESAKMVLGWQYGPMGVLLHGDTRKGKSRCAWVICERVFMSGRSVKVLDSMAGFKYMAAFSNGGKEAQEWVESFSRCGLLFFDDVFKAKLTDSFEAAVFAIVDFRMSHKLPILATLNDTGATLAARMSSDRGDALVARLKEMCATIQF